MEISKTIIKKKQKTGKDGKHAIEPREEERQGPDD